MKGWYTDYDEAVYVEGEPTRVEDTGSLGYSVEDTRLEEFALEFTLD